MKGQEWLLIVLLFWLLAAQFPYSSKTQRAVSNCIDSSMNSATRLHSQA